MHSGWWGLTRETISLLFLRHNHFSCGIFFFLIPLPIPQCIPKGQMRYRLLEIDLIGVLKTEMYYGNCIGEKKSLGKHKDQFPQSKDLSL